MELDLVPEATESIDSLVERVRGALEHVRYHELDGFTPKLVNESFTTLADRVKEQADEIAMHRRARTHLAELAGKKEARANRAEAEVQRLREALTRIAGMALIEDAPAAARAALSEEPRKEAEMDQDTEPPKEDLTYWAWTIIANVSEGDWTKQPQEWQDAATRWRDRWHESLPTRSALSEEPRT